MIIKTAAVLTVAMCVSLAAAESGQPAITKGTSMSSTADDSGHRQHGSDDHTA